ncbi:MAG TPA: hypothetical protein VIM12_12235 [Noviherbaspirillum sp.]|jgi:hypothetical protein|uniref:hypothetical protein n=1 Tax=Noviherbaspirillum sp. TaxID=1926288 RepID=UPI002F954DA6
MKTPGTEPEETTRLPARPKKRLWRTICEIAYVLAIAYFVFLIIALLIAPEGTRDWRVFALHFLVTITLGYGAKWAGDRHDRRAEKIGR